MGNSSSTASERLTLEFSRRERRSRPESFHGAVCRRRCLRSLLLDPVSLHVSRLQPPSEVVL